MTEQQDVSETEAPAPFPMYRVDIQEIGYPLFFVVDPQLDFRFECSRSEVLWEMFLAPGEYPSVAEIPAISRVVDGAEVSDIGLVGQSHADHKSHRQALNGRDLVGYEIVENPMILLDWNQWLTTTPKMSFEL